MASEFTVNALRPEVGIAQTLEVEAKGIKQTVKIHEITALGAPYDLRLKDSEQTLRNLNQALPVSFKRVTAKAIAEQSMEGAVTAAAEGVAQLETAEALELMTNLRMTIPGYPGAENDQIFGKITAVEGQQDGRSRYIVKVTSAPLEARKYIRSLIQET